MTERETLIRFKPDAAIFRRPVFSSRALMRLVQQLVPYDGELFVVVKDTRDHRTYLYGRDTRLIL
jgi:hypothetical protein